MNSTKEYVYLVILSTNIFNAQQIGGFISLLVLEMSFPCYTFVDGVSTVVMDLRFSPSKSYKTIPHAWTVPIMLILTYTTPFGKDGCFRIA